MNLRPLFRPFLKASGVVSAALLGVATGFAPACSREVPKEEAKPAASSSTSAGEVEVSDETRKAAGLLTGKPIRAARKTLITAFGTLDFVPSRVARVGPLVDGRVVSIVVEAGQDVEPLALLATVQSVEVGKFRAELGNARARLVQADADKKRQAILWEKGLTTQANLLAAETELTMAQVAFRAADERLKNIGAEGSTLSLKTPLGGKILSMNARVGQTAGPLDTLFVVGKTDVLWLGVDVYERDFAKLRLGDDVRVEVLARPGKPYVGKVDHIGEVVDVVRRATRVRVVLANADGALHPGMSATARISGTGDVAAAGPASSASTPAVAGSVSTTPSVLAKSDLTLYVPRKAVQMLDGLPFVFVEIKEGHYTFRAIERGADVEDLVEVTRGLTGDETIVVEGSFILKSELLKEQMGKND